MHGKLAFIVGLLATQASLAQASFDGTWQADFQTLRGDRAAATLTLAGGKGGWYSHPLAQPNRCVGREFPVTVRKATADELVFEVDRSSVNGCPTSVFNLKPNAAGELHGEFDGRPVKLQRK
ncbi:MAG: hypothetical protein ACO1PB_11885 [Ramlibacter sp.]